MNAHIKVAQADPASPKKPPRVVKITKPQDGQAITVELGYDQSAKLDLSEVANDKITLVHVGENLIILFDNNATVTVHPFFDSMGVPLQNLTVDVGPGRNLSGIEFASVFPITTDQSVLPAAGPAGVGPLASGASFSNATVEDLFTPNPLPLLGPETLPNFTVQFESIPLLPAPEIEVTPAPPPTPPIVAAAAVLGIDETSGVQSTGGPTEVAGSTVLVFNGAATTISSLFTTVANKGIDPDVAGGALDNGALGFATTGAESLVTLTGGSPGSTTYALTVTNPVSGLQLTDGTAITLSLDGAGRVIGTVGTDVANPGLTGKVAFAIAIDPATGQGYVAEYLSLQHPDQATAANGFNNYDELLTLAAGSLGVIVTVTSSDGTTTSTTDVSANFKFRDDGPTLSGATAAGTVDEDGVVGGVAGGPGDVAGEVTVATGSVSPLFNSGSDGPLSFSLSANTAGLPALTSAGIAVTYAVAGNTLTASAGGNTVFTFALQSNGNYTFTLLDQLDHPSLNGQAGDNTENDLAISLGSIIQATDADGDTVIAAAGGLVITVDDDTPIATAGTSTGTVDEDGVVEGAADAGPGDGIAGGTGDVAGQATVATGSVAALFQSGADAPLTFGFAGNAVATLQGLNLTSGGVALSYGIAGDTVTASAPAGNIVFTFQLTAAGNWTFTLVDQLDHAAGNNENDLTINLGAIVQATDFDGDTVTGNAAGLVITVDDDTPIATAGTSTGTVDEDGVVEGAADAGPGDGIAGGTGDVAGQATVATGSVAALFQSGADEPLTFGFAGNAVATLQGLNLTSGGVALSYGIAGNTVTATAPAGNIVFTFQLTAAGNWTFTLVDQLDHAAGNNENDLTINLGAIVQATDFDGDTVTGNAAGLVITVDDDSPIALTGANLSTGTVDEDGVFEGTQNNGPGDGVAGGPGDIVVDNADGDNDESTTSGNVSALFQSGADEPLTYSLVDTTAAQAALSALGLTSGGVALSYAVAGNVLTASAPGGNTIFTFTLNPTTGAWIFDLQDQLDHPTLDGQPGDNTENELTINLGAIVQATDRDGDTVTAAAGGLVITVDDDTPARLAQAAPISAAVLEAGLSTLGGDAGDQSEGIRAPGETLSSDEASGAVGSLTSLISTGADEPIIISLSSDTSGLPTLFSHGELLTYAVVGNTLTASTSLGTVFTLQVNTNGSWSFDLDDQLDHVAGNGENLDLRTAADGSTSVGAIDFSSLIVATDFDGDSLNVLLPGDFTIAVRDDVPGTTIVRPIAATVLEDGLSLAEGDLTEGNRENGEPLSSDEASGAPGSLTAGVLPGADEPLAFGVSVNTSGLPTLFSHGEQVIYEVVGNKLTASTLNFGQVFTLQVNIDGSWSFDLTGQIDHVDNGFNDENFALRTAADGSTSVASIDFSSLIIATDVDGDSVIVPGGLSISIQDDVPIAAATVATPILDDEDQAFGIQGAAISGDDGSGTTASGVLSALSGADGFKSFEFANTVTVNGGAVAQLKVIHVDPVTHVGTQENVALTWTPNASGGGTLAGTSASYPIGTPAFTLTVDASGNYTFTAFAPLVHPTVTTEDNLTLAFTYTVTDGDGDTASNTLTVNVDDDLATAAATVATPILDDEDQAFGIQGAAISGDDGSGTTASGVLSALSGADGFKSFEFANTVTVNGGAVAQLKVIHVDPVTHVGTQENVALTWTPNASGGGTLAGTSASYPIGTPAFTLTVDASGNYTFTAFAPLVHPTVTTEDNLTLAFTYTVTDGDGDTASNTLTVNVDDDLATAAATVATPILDDEDQAFGIQGAAISGDDGSGTTASGVLSALSGADGFKSFEFANTVTVNGGAVAQLKVIHVDPVTHVGTQENVALTWTPNASGGGTLAGTSASYPIGTPAFTLTVDASGNYTFTAFAPLVHPTVTTEDNLTLAFTYTVTDGDGDTASNTLTVNVDDDLATAAATVATPILDDEDQAFGIQGAAISGDDGSGTTASGVLSALSGADGFKSFEFANTVTVNGGAVAQLKVIHVDPVTHVGTQENVALTWTPNASGGGTLAGTSASYPIGTPAFTLTVDASGNYTFTAFAPLVHPTVTTEDNLTLAFTYTVTDGDGDTASNTLTVNVDDDLATAAATVATPILDDEDQAFGIQGAAISGDDGSGTTASGVLSALSGADGFKSFEFANTVTVNGGAVAQLKVIHVDPVTHVGTQENVALTWTPNASGGGTLAGTSASYPIGTPAFTLTVDASGNYTFTAFAPLVHPTVTTEDNLTLAFTYTVTDGDGDTASNTLTVNVDDDLATAAATVATPILDDEDQAFGIQGAAISGDDGSGTTASGVLSALSGADGFKSFEFANTVTVNGGAVAQLKVIHVDPVTHVGTQENVALTWTPNASGGGTLAGTSASYPIGTPAFTLTVDASGNYTFTAFAPLVHPTVTTEDNLTLAFTYTVTDGDGDTASNTLTVNVDDDLATAAATVATPILDDEDQAFGIQGAAISGDDGSGTTASGVLSALSGADGFKSFEFANTVTVNGGAVAQLKVIHVDPVTHVGTQENVALTWTPNASGGGTLAGTSASYPIGTPAFTLTVDASGNYTFTAFAPLVHPTVTTEDNLTLAFTYTVTDGDGDTASNTLTVNVDDDLATAAATVATPILDDEDQAFGIQGAAISGDDGSGTTASGVLSALSGADGFKSFEFANTVTVNGGAVAQLKVIHVDPVTHVGTQENVALTWTPNASGGGTLAGTSASYPIGTPAFTLTVDASGNYTFTAFAPLVHPTVTTEDNLTLAFTYTVTDGDGDTASNTLTVNVDDDLATAAATVATPILDDEDQAFGIQGAAISGDDGSGTTASGVLSALSGADGFKSFEFANTVTVNGGAVAQLKVIHVDPVTHVGTQENVALTWTPNASGGGTLAGTSASYPIGTPAFTLTVDASGNYTFTAFAPLVHPTVTTEDNLTLAFTYTVTDGDGDTASNTLTVNVDDDLATAAATVATPILDDEDQAFGIQGAAISGDDGSGTTASGVLSALSGADGFKSFEFANTVTVNGGAVAQLKVIHVDPVTHVGTQENVALTWTPNASGGGTLAGTSASYPIGTPAFTLTVDASGNYTFTAFAPLVHPTVTTEDNLTLAFTYTVTDGDGDTASNTLTVNVDDDLATAAATVATPILDDEDQAFGIQGAAISGDDGSGTTASGVLSALSGADGFKSFEFANTVTVNGGAVAQLKVIHVDPVTHVGTQENVALTWTPNASGGGTLAGTSASYPIGTPAFTLTVDASGNYTFTAFAPLVHPTVTTEDNLTLAFTYTVTDGDGDTASNTLTVNVDDDLATAAATVATPILDDEDQAFGIQGAAISGDDGSGTTASGVLSALSGADGFKSFEFANTVTVNGGAVAQLKVIHVDPVTHVGTQENVALTWTPNASGGGTLAGTSASYPIGTPAFTLTVDASGNYTFTAFAPLVHPTVTTEDNLTLAFTYTVTDGDGDTASNTLTVNVDDDLATAAATVATPILDDEDQAFGIQGAAISGDDGSGTTASGVLSALSGADGFKSFEFANTVTVNGGAVAQLKVIHVDPVTHVGTQENVALTWTPNASGGGTLAGTSASYPIGTPAFTLTVDASGNYTFTAFAPLVHPTVTTEDNLTLAFTYTVTDGDGDTASNTLTVNVDDDLATAAATVATPILDDEDQAFGIQGAAISGDDGSGTTASGVLSALSGADGFKSFEFANTVTVNGGAVAQLKVIHVDPVTHVGTQENVALTWTPNASGGGTLAGTSASYPIGTPAFTLTVDASGNYTFTAFAPLVHPTVTTEDNLTLAFTYTVTDGDGDTASNTLTVNVDDDLATAAATVATPILDDEAQTLFTANPGNPPGGSGDASPDVKVATGIAGSLFTAGADGLQSVSFTNPVGLKAIYKDPTSGLALQETLTYTPSTTATGHTILTATGVTSGNTVFTLDVGPDGSYTFTASKPLVHGINGTAEEDLGVVIGFTVTDGDGDQSPGQLTINVDDDTPVVNSVQDAIVPNVVPTDVQGIWQPLYGADGPSATAAVGISIGATDSTGTLTYSVTDVTDVGGHNVFRVDVFSGATLQYSFYEYSSFNGVTGNGEMFAFTDAGITNSYFTLTANVDGTYEFHLDDNTGFSHEVLANASSAKPGNYNPQMYIEGTNFYDGATLPPGTTPDITVDGFLGAVDQNVFVNANGITVGSGNFDTGESMSFAFNQGQTKVEYTIGKFHAGDSATFSVSVDGSPAHTYVIDSASPLLNVLAADFGLTTFTSVYITKINPGPPPGFGPDDPDVAIDAIRYNAETTISSTALNFVLSVTDGDGDKATSTDPLNVSLVGTGSSLSGTNTQPEVISATSAADTISGGTGLGDTIDYENSNAGVNVNLATNTVSGGWSAGDTISNFENVIGSQFADSLTAASGGSILVGLGGFDTLTGGIGVDTLIGGAGDDALVGNGGNDKFVLQGAAGGHDTINDLSSALGNTDGIFVDVNNQALSINTAQGISSAQFGSSNVLGSENLAASWSGTPNSFFFNSNVVSQELWYSANGTGSDKIDLAHITSGVPTFSNIYIF